MELADAALADEPLPAQQGFLRFIRHEPVGVVLDIAAWNYPLLVPINVVAAAVLAGDAVLLKHAPRTALVGEQIAESVRYHEGAAPKDARDRTLYAHFAHHHEPHRFPFETHEMPVDEGPGPVRLLPGARRVAPGTVR
ncbi:MAG: aldehyde dehydrogenase family protein, partial [Deltaproteobacteria bacterium]|nr:aldehyde dehydrogenase family protein [Deltaproteobacteria bacterium]